MNNKYVFFWSGVFSQWYESKFQINGVTFNTAEQYMMYQKARVFNDTEIAEQILATNDPAKQKELGRKVSGFNKTVWDKFCLSVVYEGNMAKFSQNDKLKKKLLSTGNKVLVESSPKDFIWGIGMHKDDIGVDNPVNWLGTNLLGFTLMLVRNELRNNEVESVDVEKLLKENGWSIECMSPFEIRHKDGDFATGQAAKAVIEYLK